MKVVFHAVASVLAALSLTACVAPFPPVLDAENTDRIEKVLVQAYEDTGEAFLEDIALSGMALAGLENLKTIEPGLTISESDGTVTLSRWSQPFFSFTEPSNNTAHDWADVVSDALIATHEHSGSLQKTEPDRIYDTYMEGLASALGKDSRYFPSEEFYGYLRADFDGLVDLTYAKSAEGLRIVSLDHTGHLGAAGLQTDDVITHIGGRATAALSQFEVFSLLSGPVDSALSLRVLRDGVALPSAVIVQRWQTEPRSYELNRRGSIAVYDLPELNEFGARELAGSLSREIRDAELKDRPLTGLILDLRGGEQHDPDAISMPSITFGTSRLDWSTVVGYIDYGFMSGPGGSPNAARLLATAFMSDGVLFRRRGRQDTANAVIEAGGSNPSGQLPLAILVDSSTIGGAELVAAALQDSGRALVIGTSTAGSGVIRRNVSLYNLGVINLAWARAYAPSGYALAGRGVMPQICTSLPNTTLGETLVDLRRGVGLTEADARARHIDSENKNALAQQRSHCPAEAEDDGLAEELALAIVNDPALYARLIRSADGS